MREEELKKAVEKIVRTVREEIKNHQHHGPDDFRPEEHGAELVMENIRSRGLSGKHGLRLKGEIKNPEIVPDLSENMETVEWAAKQYFKLLLIDLYRFPRPAVFKNHSRCTPELETWESK